MPFHKDRRWHIADIVPESLAGLLARDEHRMVLCQGYRTPGGTLWLNDSISEDAPQEYAVLRPCSKVWRMQHPVTKKGWVQVESITTSWCDSERLLEYIQAFDDEQHDNEDGVFATTYPPLTIDFLDFPWKGGRYVCELCR